MEKQDCGYDKTTHLLACGSSVMVLTYYLLAFYSFSKLWSQDLDFFVAIIQTTVELEQGFHI